MACHLQLGLLGLDRPQAVSPGLFKDGSVGMHFSREAAEREERPQEHQDSVGLFGLTGESGSDREDKARW